MLEYIYDFLSVLFDKLKEREEINSIILFGSFARGKQRKDSDIDIFIDVEEKNKNKISLLVKESLNEFELKAEKTWKLRGITNPIVPIIDSLNSEQWKELNNDIQNYGKILYGNYKIKDKILISYNFSTLKQKDKMQVIRKLFGYKLKKGKKTYEQKGLIFSLNSQKVSNALIIDVKNSSSIIELLKKNKVKFEIKTF